MTDYATYLIGGSFLFLVLASIMFFQTKRVIEKLIPIYTFLSYGFIVLSIFTLITGLTYTTEYNNNPPCENLVNSTTIDASTNITAYTYVSSCFSRPAFELGNYLLIILVWSGFILGLLIVISLIILLGRMLSQW